MSEDPSRAAWLPQARSYLRRADPVLARLIDDRPAFDPRAWLAQLPARHRGRVPVRFDVVSVYLVTDEPEFEHILGAFPYRESR